MKKLYNIEIITPSQHPPLHELLQQQLQIANQLDHKTIISNTSGDMVEVPNMGKAVSSAYEQLRNAAEYAEEHILLQRAIKRFCRRELFLSKRDYHGLGSELITDLVQAGYLKGNRFSKNTATKIEELIGKYLTAYGQLRQSHVERDTAMDWVLALISNETENILNPHHAQQATVLFAYQYFLQSVPRDRFIDIPESASYEFCLYIAVHQAILKSDIDIVRYEMLTLYKQSPEDIAGFKHLNQQIDQLYSSQLTLRLKRVIGRYCAPFRVLKSMLEYRSNIAELLPNKQHFMDAFTSQINLEYKQVHRRLNQRLIKSIIFIFITKVIIGIAVEIPYDILLHGSVALIPLAVNLLFPPLYMASLKLSLRPPSKSSARGVHNYMEKLLYDDTEMLIPVHSQRRTSAAAKLVYPLLFIVPLAITVLILNKIGFNAIQMIIFFIFFSTASFLGFRLNTLVHELELVTRQNGLLASLRDFFYLPFIVLGHWLSRKYGKINAVGRFLDVAIELPLKAVLRLARQWIRFVNEKHEQLY